MIVDLTVGRPVPEDKANLINAELVSSEIRTGPTVNQLGLIEGVPAFLMPSVEFANVNTGVSTRTDAEAGSLPPPTQLRTDTAVKLVETPPAPVANLLDDVTKPRLSAEEENKAKYGVGKWEPQKLSSRHREMMRRVLEGATYVEIAEQMGLSTQSIMLVCSSEMFRTELAKMDEQLDLNVIRRAEELSNEALDKLKHLMRRAKAETLQASCAEKVLGIAGYSKIEKKQIAVVSGEDVIRELNRRRREMLLVNEATA